MLAAGPAIADLEERIADYVGAPHAVGVQSGTAALHLALLAAGVGKGDLVIVPEITFVATANAVRYCGAEPVFADVDQRTGLIDPEPLRTYLSQSCEARNDGTVEKDSGMRVAAIVVVDLYGHPVEADSVTMVARDHKVAVVEDAAQALGAVYRGRPAGGLHEFATLSFNGNKVITGGGGGMVVLRTAEAAEYCRYLANQARDDPVTFDHREVGFNYRMPNIIASIILTQFGRLDAFVSRKRGIVASYADRLAGTPGAAMVAEAEWAQSSCWMAVLDLDPNIYPHGAAPVIAGLNARGVGARPTWIPLPDLAPYSSARRLGDTNGRDYHRRTLCLPCSTGIGEDEIEAVSTALDAVLQDTQALAQ